MVGALCNSGKARADAGLPFTQGRVSKELVRRLIPFLVALPGMFSTSVYKAIRVP